VYSDKIYHYLAENSNDKNQNIKFVQDWKSEAVNEIDPNYLSKTKSEIQLLMRKSAGIVRNDKDLNTAKIKLHYFQKEIEEQINNHVVNVGLAELRNLITIGSLIVQQSIDQIENRGGFIKI
jgi:L-aspartate oxidase